MYAEDENESRALAVVPQRGGAILPVATAEEMRAAIAAYEDMKTAILMPSDIQRIGNKDHIKRSGWVRIARAFGVSTRPVSEEYCVDAADGSWGYAVVVEAIAPNGARMTGDGTCWSTEKKKGQDTRHNVRAYAFTRAMNRAISNLVGGGEVSAEELTDYVESYSEAPRPQQRQTAANGKPARYLIGSNMSDNARFKALGLNTPAAVKGFLVEHRVNLQALTQEAVTAALDAAEREARTVDATPAAEAHDLRELGTVRV